MTTPALQDHKPRELTDVLIADRERLRKWIKYIEFTAIHSHCELLPTQIAKLCALALKGHDAP